MSGIVVELMESFWFISITGTVFYALIVLFLSYATNGRFSSSEKARDDFKSWTGRYVKIGDEASKTIYYGKVLEFHHDFVILPEAVVVTNSVWANSLQTVDYAVQGETWVKRFEIKKISEFPAEKFHHLKLNAVDFQNVGGTVAEDFSPESVIMLI